MLFLVYCVSTLRRHSVRGVGAAAVTIFFSGDHHFGHENVIAYCERPFVDVAEMDSALVECWNDHVGHDDLVYYLGDFTLKDRKAAEYYFAQLNGAIHMLRYDFHHDKKWLKGEGPYYSRHLSKSNIVISFQPGVVLLKDMFPVPVALCHFPIHSWPRRHYGSYHLFGHCHNRYKPHNLSLDIGVDSVYNILEEYRPFSLDEVVEIMNVKRKLYAEKALDKR